MTAAVGFCGIGLTLIALALFLQVMQLGRANYLKEQEQELKSKGIDVDGGPRM